MEKNFGAPVITELFSDISAEVIEKMLACFRSYEREYQSGEFLFHATDYIHQIGIIREGAIHLISEDFWGNQFIFTEYSAGAIFGEAYSLTSEEPLLLSIVAVTHTRVLYLDMQRVLTQCGNGCACHQRLLHNLLRTIAQKKIAFLHKIEHISRKTLREKIVSYLSDQSKKQGSPVFEIPFNRQQMADYLGVDRSAMSAELSRMQKEGLLSYRRNHFVLH